MPNMKIHMTLSVSVASLAAILAAFPCACADHRSHVTQFGNRSPQAVFDSSQWTQALNDPQVRSQLDPETLQLYRAVAFGVGILGALIAGCCIFSGALMHRKCAKHTPLATEIRPVSGNSDFEYGLCEGLCHSWRITCWGCCCCPVLWSATASSPKSKLWGWDFWWMIFLMTTIAQLYYFLRYTVPWFGSWGQMLVSSLLAFQLLIVVHHRQHLRRIFSMEHGTFRSLIQDFFTWACCSTCATIQEALQVGYVGDPVLNTPLWDDGTAPVPMHMLS